MFKQKTVHENNMSVAKTFSSSKSQKKLYDMTRPSLLELLICASEQNLKIKLFYGSLLS